MKLKTGKNGDQWNKYLFEKINKNQQNLQTSIMTTKGEKKELRHQYQK
jgi:hypothetical protein